MSFEFLRVNESLTHEIFHVITSRQFQNLQTNDIIGKESLTLSSIQEGTFSTASTLYITYPSSSSRRDLNQNQNQNISLSDLTNIMIKKKKKRLDKLQSDINKQEE